MKTLTQTIIVIVASGLLVAGFAPAKNVSDEEVGDSLEMQAREAEIAAEVVQKQAETAQKQAEVAQAQTRQAEGEAAQRRSMFSAGFGSTGWSRTGSTGAVLVIPAAEIKAEEIIAVTEDMNVMARIFEKNLQQAHIATARGGLFLSDDYVFGTLLGRGRGAMQSMYLQGYGALFLMKVDFPLSPPPQVEQEKETKQEEDTDPVWTEMKQEMFEPEVSRRHRTDRSEQKKYDAEKVENLKATLVKALKHASNIRSLKPDESVVLTITGSGQATGTTITAARLSGENQIGENQILVQERTSDGKKITKIVTGTSLDDIGSSSTAILVIRAKKSDIDSFATGNLDFEKFRQRVQVLTCPCLGGVAGQGDPFGLYRRSRPTSSSNMRMR